MDTVRVSSKPTSNPELATVLERLLASIAASDIAHAALTAARQALPYSARESGEEASIARALGAVLAVARRLPDTIREASANAAVVKSLRRDGVRDDVKANGTRAERNRYSFARAVLRTHIADALNGRYDPNSEFVTRRETAATEYAAAYLFAPVNKMVRHPRMTDYEAPNAILAGYIDHMSVCGWTNDEERILRTHVTLAFQRKTGRALDPRRLLVDIAPAHKMRLFHGRTPGVCVLWHQGAIAYYRPYSGRWRPILLDGGVPAEAWSRNTADLIEPEEV